MPQRKTKITVKHIEVSKKANDVVIDLFTQMLTISVKRNNEAEFEAFVSENKSNLKIYGGQLIDMYLEDATKEPIDYTSIVATFKSETQRNGEQIKLNNLTEEQLKKIKIDNIIRFEKLQLGLDRVIVLHNIQYYMLPMLKEGLPASVYEKHSINVNQHYAEDLYFSTSSLIEILFNDVDINVDVSEAHEDYYSIIENIKWINQCGELPINILFDKMHSKWDSKNKESLKNLKKIKQFWSSLKCCAFFCEYFGHQEENIRIRALMKAIEERIIQAVSKLSKREKHAKNPLMLLQKYLKEYRNAELENIRQSEWINAFAVLRRCQESPRLLNAAPRESSNPIQQPDDAKEDPQEVKIELEKWHSIIISLSSNSKLQLSSQLAEDFVRILDRYCRSRYSQFSEEIEISLIKGFRILLDETNYRHNQEYDYGLICFSSLLDATKSKLEAQISKNSVQSDLTYLKYLPKDPNQSKIRLIDFFKPDSMVYKNNAVTSRVIEKYRDVAFKSAVHDLVEDLVDPRYLLNKYELFLEHLNDIFRMLNEHFDLSYVRYSELLRKTNSQYHLDINQENDLNVIQIKNQIQLDFEKVTVLKNLLKIVLPAFKNQLDERLYNKIYLQTLSKLSELLPELITFSIAILQQNQFIFESKSELAAHIEMSQILLLYGCFWHSHVFEQLENNANDSDSIVIVHDINQLIKVLNAYYSMMVLFLALDNKDQVDAIYKNLYKMALSRFQVMRTSKNKTNVSKVINYFEAIISLLFESNGAANTKLQLVNFDEITGNFSREILLVDRFQERLLSLSAATPRYSVSELFNAKELKLLPPEVRDFLDECLNQDQNVKGLMLSIAKIAEVGNESERDALADSLIAQHKETFTLKLYHLINLCELYFRYNMIGYVKNQNLYQNVLSTSEPKLVDKLSSEIKMLCIDGVVMSNVWKILFKALPHQKSQYLQAQTRVQLIHNLFINLPHTVYLLIDMLMENKIPQNEVYKVYLLIIENISCVNEFAEDVRAEIIENLEFNIRIRAFDSVVYYYSNLQYLNRAFASIASFAMFFSLKDILKSTAIQKQLLNEEITKIIQLLKDLDFEIPVSRKNEVPIKQLRHLDGRENTIAQMFDIINELQSEITSLKIYQPISEADKKAFNLYLKEIKEDLNNIDLEKAKNVLYLYVNVVRGCMLSHAPASKEQLNAVCIDSFSMCIIIDKLSKKVTTVPHLHLMMSLMRNIISVIKAKNDEVRLLAEKETPAFGVVEVPQINLNQCHTMAENIELEKPSSPNVDQSAFVQVNRDNEKSDIELSQEENQNEVQSLPESMNHANAEQHDDIDDLAATMVHALSLEESPLPPLSVSQSSLDALEVKFQELYVEEAQKIKETMKDRFQEELRVEANQLDRLSKKFNQRLKVYRRNLESQLQTAEAVVQSYFQKKKNLKRANFRTQEAQLKASYKLQWQRFKAHAMEAYQNELSEIEAQHDVNMTDIQQRYNQKVDRLNAEHQAQLDRLNAEHETQLASIIKRYEGLESNQRDIANSSLKMQSKKLSNKLKRKKKKISKKISSQPLVLPRVVEATIAPGEPDYIANTPLDSHQRSCQINVELNSKAQISLPQSLKMIMYELEQAGKACRLVGGAVRKKVLGIFRHGIDDFDVMVNIDPHDLPLSLKMFCKQNSYEPRLWRMDDVEFWCEPWGQLSEALRTRDFTINTLTATWDGHVYDELGVWDDLEREDLVLLGDPDERFISDPILMLRMIYLSASSEFRLTENLINALLKHQDKIKTIPLGRYRAFINKLFLSDYNVQVLCLSSELGALSGIFPFLPKNYSHYYEHQPYLFDFWKNKLAQYSSSHTNYVKIIALFMLFPIVFNEHNNISEKRFIQDQVDLALNQFPHFSHQEKTLLFKQISEYLWPNLDVEYYQDRPLGLFHEYKAYVNEATSYHHTYSSRRYTPQYSTRSRYPLTAHERINFQHQTQARFKLNIRSTQ